MGDRFRIVIGSDDAGVRYKEVLAKDLAADERVADLIDIGVDLDEDTHYPHIAAAALVTGGVRGYISSIIGESGNIGQANYSAAKAGLFGLTMSLAQETARKGITVNDVAPGYISTDMVAAVPQEAMAKVIAKIPVGRLGEPDEIARMVEFLADPDSGFITGQVFSVNGGQYM
jgi:NAD(P)-dependent dehydrogenase (short-subunit alcohol dehydrogenase family)